MAVKRRFATKTFPVRSRSSRFNFKWIVSLHHRIAPASILSALNRQLRRRRIAPGFGGFFIRANAWENARRIRHLQFVALRFRRTANERMPCSDLPRACKIRGAPTYRLLTKLRSDRPQVPEALPRRMRTRPFRGGACAVADDPAAICPSCRWSETGHDQGGTTPGDPGPPQPARRGRTMASVVSAITSPILSEISRDLTCQR